MGAVDLAVVAAWRMAMVLPVVIGRRYVAGGEAQRSDEILLPMHVCLDNSRLLLTHPAAVGGCVDTDDSQRPSSTQ